MSRTYDVVVAGAGAAGLSAATAARQTNPSASILLINDEDRAPYKRTRISKSIADGYHADAFGIRDNDWYARERIDRVDGVSVRTIDPAARSLQLTDESETVTYGSLVLAVGGEPMFPRIVRPHEKGSFFVVRSARDGEELRNRAKKARSVLIAGMGVLAVELAQQLRAMGKQVTLAGATPQLMPRQLNARAGEILEDVLTQNKVKMLFQEEILSFERNKKNWTVEMLKHSAHYDMVVFCIGVEPRVEVARAAGLAVNRGIKVDETLRTSDPHIFAAGDCAEHEDGTVTYLWEAADDQGRVAGTNAAGGEAHFDRLPRRLTSTLFGQYVFSISKPREPWEFEVDEFENERQFYALYWNEDHSLRGAVMLNDEDYGDLLEAAVREGWSRSKVLESLELEDA